MNKNNFCIIMAGGVGSRFWPLSRQSHPKQFLDILGTGKTFIRQTFDRFRQVIPEENIFVVTNSDYKSLVSEQLPELNPANVLLEPLRRNTAPCIAYASFRIRKLNPAARIVVAPSDHLIIREEEFLRVVESGLDFVDANKALLTIGIKPSRPETGYGYIQVNGESDIVNDFPGFRKVKTFTEKPDIKLARVFVESGEFFWNSGIFFWSLESIMSAFSVHLPEIYSLFADGDPVYGTAEESQFISNAYPHCKSISIDYGIMEKAGNVFVLGSDFGWSDIGTWGSLHEHQTKDSRGNAISGEGVFGYELDDCIIRIPDDKLAVIEGLKDYIVVESDGILLVCRKSEEQSIRQFVNEVKMKRGEQYL
ncbi:MAG: mannose-1-phosphate guanylyltransferase [Bacteroidales bacterium]